MPFLAGNALAVHDIEYATLGTSLGMNVRDGTLRCKRSQKSYGSDKCGL